MFIGTLEGKEGKIPVRFVLPAEAIKKELKPSFELTSIFKGFFWEHAFPDFVDAENQPKIIIYEDFSDGARFKGTVQLCDQQIHAANFGGKYKSK